MSPSPARFGYRATFVAALVVAPFLLVPSHTQDTGDPARRADTSGRDSGPVLPISSPTNPLPEGVLLRIDGKDISASDYRDHAFRRTGMSGFLDFVDGLLVAKKAAELGVTVTREELDAAVERLVQSRIELLAGDPARFDESLRRQFYTAESWRAWQRRRLHPELLAGRCVLEARTITDADVRRKFEAIYGPDGVMTQVRQIFIAGHRKVPGGTPESLSRDLVERLSSQPERFVELVREYSDHAPSRRNDGLIPGYRPGQTRVGSVGKAFDEAVARLEDVGQIAGPVESELGYHIIQLVSRTETRSEDVSAEIRTHLERQPPTPSELLRFKRELRRAARIEM